MERANGQKRITLGVERTPTGMLHAGAAMRNCTWYSKPRAEESSNVPFHFPNDYAPVAIPVSTADLAEKLMIDHTGLQNPQ